VPSLGMSQGSDRFDQWFGCQPASSCCCHGTPSRPGLKASDCPCCCCCWHASRASGPKDVRQQLQHSPLAPSGVAPALQRQRQAAAALVECAITGACTCFQQPPRRGQAAEVSGTGAAAAAAGRTVQEPEQGVAPAAAAAVECGNGGSGTSESGGGGSCCCSCGLGALPPALAALG